MKKLFVLGLLCTLTLNVWAVEKETIEIVKPLIPLHEAVIDRGDGWGPQGGARVEAITSGSFQSSFKSKQECLNWAKQSVKTLQLSLKTIYSASCSNKDLAPLYFEAGHFVGNVSYL